MKKLLALSLALVMTVMMFAGCNGNNNSSSGSSTPGVTATKDIIVNLASEPPMLNSVLTTSTGSMNVLRHIMDGLTMLNQQDEAVGAVAEKWTITDDGLTYTFNLKKGLKWSNGEEVTAHDFIFAWDLLFTTETAAPYAGTWAPLILGANEKLEGTALSAEDQALLTELGYADGIGFKAIDDYTIQITTTGPYPYFLSVLAFPNFYPLNEKGYNEVGGTDKYATEAEYLVTNGAFTMTSWAHEDSLVLEKDPNYWDAANIKLDKITMLMIADTGTILNTFRAGEADMVGLNGAQTAQMRGEGYTVLDYDDGSIWYFEFNTTQPGLNNKKVRQALTLAIDVPLFIETIRKDDSKVAYSFVPNAIQNGSFTAAVGKLINRVEDDDYSAVKALLEEGLAEEGMTIADLTIAIVTDEGDTAADTCAFYQEQWKTHLGLNVTVEQMTYKNRIERMQQHDFSVVNAGWGPDYNDPMTFLDLFVTGNGNNHTSYSNPAYDALVSQAMLEADAAKRQEILIEIEKVLIEDMPVGPVWNRARNYICSDRLTGVVRTAFDDMNFRWAEVVS